MNKFSRVESRNQLLDIILNSNPNKSQNQGFWLYVLSLKKDFLGYTAIGKAPYYIEFEMYGTDEEIAAGQPKGLISYTLHPYRQSEGDPLYGNTLHIFDIQTDSRYHGLLKEYLARFEYLARLNHKAFITLHPYAPSLIPLYQKFGFSDSGHAQSNFLLKQLTY